MTLAPRDPFSQMAPLRDVMNRLFEESLVRPRFELLSNQFFPIDVRETEDKREYVVEASLPGVKPDDIQITAEGNTLNIRVVRKMEEEKKKGRYVQQELYIGEMSRSISLPTRIDPDKVVASYNNGILTLHIPKSEDMKQKQIRVKSKEMAAAH